MTQMTNQRTIDQAWELQQNGKPKEAEALAQQILEKEPEHAPALFLLGTIACDAGELEKAVDLIGRAIAKEPSAGQFHCNLGNALQGMGRLDEAIASYAQALKLRPELVDASNGMGFALMSQGKTDEAIVAYREAIARQPTFVEAQNNLGNALEAAGQFDAAAVAFRAALRVRPDYAEAHINLGSLLCRMGWLNDGIASLRRGVELRPDLAAAHNNLAGALEQQGKHEQAIAAYRSAVEVAPNEPQVHFNLGTALLRQGDFAQGLQEYEWRCGLAEEIERARTLVKPRWDGSELRGRRILLDTEQGLGDAIQFVRYAPLIQQHGCKVLLRCRPELARLFAGISGVEQVVTPRDPLPEFDFHFPLMSLPKAFGTTLITVPAGVPYLSAEPQRVSVWRERIEKLGTALKVGLVWAGGAEHKDDRIRSLPLSALSPLAIQANVQFISLQKGAAADQARTPPAGMKLTDWTSELNDLADTAALIAKLDLVITADTVVAHLAGAMGRPVWVLLPFVADWRWLMNRSDSPWYPTMRLFRQPVAGDWRSAINGVVDALGSFRVTSR